MGKKAGFKTKRTGTNVVIGFDTRLIKDEGWDKARGGFEKVKALKPILSMGVHEGAEPYEEGPHVAEIAIANHYGTGRIPSRPYLVNAVDQNKVLFRKKMVDAFKDIMDGQDPDKALGELGELVVSKIKKTIVDFSDPPNAPRTIREKGTDNPLIDTGRLLNSQTWELSRSDGIPLGKSPTKTI